MVELPNAKRTIEQAIYTPIVLKKNPDDDRSSGAGSSSGNSPRRAFEKFSFTSILNPRKAELVELRKRLKEKLRASDKTEGILKDLKTVESAVPLQSPNAIMHAKSFGNIESDNLIQIAENLINLREEETHYVIKGQKKILEAFNIIKLSAEDSRSRDKIESESIPKGWKRADISGITYPVYQFEEKKEAKNGTFSSLVSKAKIIFPTPKDKIQPANGLSDLDLTVKTLMDWAIKKDIEPTIAVKTIELAEQLGLSMDSITIRDFEDISTAAIMRNRTALLGFTQHVKVNPVGAIHLERLSFTPAGIERGELVYSVPLSPAEEVNISHKEWSNTSEEFEKIVTDYLEEYSEEGVTEKSELAQSTSSQDQHSSGLNTAVTASGSYGNVQFTATAGYNVADTASNSEQSSRTSSSSVTRKASSRTKKEHKMSFKVASAAGTEDMAIRKIKNPLPNKSARVDYYQLIRKWKVDLYRYGIRLTYDITIPEPAIDILSKMLEIEIINDQLGLGFTFNLLPNAINRNNYAGLASQYSALIPEPPPDEEIHLIRAQVYNWPSKDEAQKYSSNVLEIDLDDKYYVSNSTGMLSAAQHPDTDPGYVSMWTIPPILNIGKSRKFVVAFEMWRIATLTVRVEIDLKLKDSAFSFWRDKTWNTIRDAASTRYYETRQMLKERLSQLQQELGAQDALSLRKREREEIMKVALRWLFGPSFKFYPNKPQPTLPLTPLPGTSSKPPGPKLPATVGEIMSESDQMWSEGLLFGEMIKFLHQAVEWENMLYFLYPYFWSNPIRLDFKKYLDHPDSLHKVFLKSGSARVVLPIRPGFEKDFVAFTDTTTLNPLTMGHPYLTIANEIENYAKTNYPGIRPANPIENARPLLYPKQKKAWKEIQTIMGFLEIYFNARNKYPSLLADLIPYGNVPLKDPWGNDYGYTFPGLNADYDLVSYGADGIKGGDGENEDITSWAEASLIGTWNEYTPTSALDIEFDTGSVPSA